MFMGIYVARTTIITKNTSHIPKYTDFLKAPDGRSLSFTPTYLCVVKEHNLSSLENWNIWLFALYNVIPD